VIGIGAINYDYIFRYDPKIDVGKSRNIDAGPENLRYGEKRLQDLIKKRVLLGGPFVAELGGSAYLTIKTISAMHADLTTSFVGVYSPPEKMDIENGILPNEQSEFSHLTDQSWLFRVKGTPGRAMVLLHRGQRYTIDISPGSNKKLKEKIHEREQEQSKQGRPDAFNYFLSSAKWIHLTSLSDIKQFDFIVDRIGKAKQINQNIRISTDVGHQYTKEYASRLKAAFSIADYIFLTINELDNLIGGSDYKWRNRVDAVGELIKDNPRLNTQVFVIKGPSRNVLINYQHGEPYSRTFWHPVLLKIRNDTGAGDVFAGGVIVGLLSPNLLIHQPAPIKLGALMASERLRSKKFPTESLGLVARRYFESSQRNEHYNTGQLLKAFWESKKRIVFDILMPIVAGVISYFITRAIIH
jgi:sugar/nucleoside kinase (ribokinase family)